MAQYPNKFLDSPPYRFIWNLSNNLFTGSLPIGGWEFTISLGELDVSDNMLSGELPSSLGGCESLEVLHLQGNLFKGSIPLSMSSVRGIQDLDLSRNNFSGEIPHFLEGFRILNNLNLSFNQFWGVVPTGGVFKNASAISVVGNTNLCSLVANLKLPKCKSKETKKRRLSRKLETNTPFSIRTYSSRNSHGVLLFLSLFVKEEKERNFIEHFGEHYFASVICCSTQKLLTGFLRG